MRTNFYRGALLLMIFFSAIACKKNETKKIQKDKTLETTDTLNVSGNYVSQDYSKRNEGYDWVSIKVSEADNNQLNISVRSRADKKEPSCTFDAIAKKRENKVYLTQIDGKSILFEFINGKISVSTEKKEDRDILSFYCSRGVSIEGTYLKINDVLDQNQIDKTKFNRVLNLQDVGFNISSIEKNGKNTLTIFTFGLNEREYNNTINIDGEEVIHAEVEDLNSDESPELFVYTQSIGTGSYGKVYAFSVNNKNSMSEVYFQPTSENSMINEGYMGHDEFSVVENTLGQRFPIYKQGITNVEQTGKTRQVSYRLVEGEAMKKLEVDKITEY